MSCVRIKGTRMAKVNLKLLQTFLLVAEHGSFRRASEYAHRAPSAISMQIRDLEAQVGMRLFVRTAQRISLTPEGRALFERTKSAMDQVEQGLSELSDIAARRRGQLTIACAPTLASSYLGNVLANFAHRFPDSVVSVREVPPREGLELLQRQKVEFYIGPEIADLKDFSFEPLINDQLFACAPEGYDPGGDCISLAELGQIPVILLDARTALRPLVDRICAKSGTTLNIRYELQHTSTALGLVEAGLGIAILPEIALPAEAHTSFRAIPLSDAMSIRRIGIVTTKGYVQHGYTEQLLNVIRADFGGTGLVDLA